MFFAALLFGPCILNTITQFITSQIESIKLQMVIVQYSPLNDGELWMPYQNLRWCFLQWVTEASRGENEEEKLKFYITSCSFCLCNSACSLQSLDHVGHVFSESEASQYEEPELISLTFVLLFAIAKPLQTCLIMPVQVLKLYNPFVQGSDFRILTPACPPA